MFMKKQKLIFVSFLILIPGFLAIVLRPAHSTGVFAKIFTKNNENISLVSNTSPNPVDQRKKEKFLTDIAEVYDYIKEQYYEEVEDDNMFEGALQGIMSNLGDPYSTYVTKEKAKTYQENIQGTFGGLGIFINEGLDEESNIHYIKVISPIEGTPAYYIGLRSGDLIVSIDDKSAAQMSTTDAVKLMRGEPGTKVTLTIKRGTKIFKVTIVRDIIKTVDLRSGHINNDIAYIRILRFNPNTPDAFSDALKKIDKRNYKTLIVDLRDNPGGSLQAVLQTANFFFKDGTLLLGTESRIPSEVREYTATSLQMVPDEKKVVVMINKGSASASEIFSGAIKDNKRGVLVGEKSFGKGLVQSVIPYNGGYITMTISQYYTPSRNFINEKGIEPDIEILDTIAELSPEETIHVAEMIDRNFVQDFIETKKGKLTENSVEEFQKELAKKGWTIKNKDYLKRLLYINRERYENIIATFSLEIDSVLSDTVDKITKGVL